MVLDDVIGYRRRGARRRRLAGVVAVRSRDVRVSYAACELSSWNARVRSRYPPPTDQRIVLGESLRWSHFIPRASGLQSSEAALHEYVGLLALAAGFE